MTEHQQRMDRLAAQLRALPPGAPVRLAKRTSNLFRTRSSTGHPGLDVTDFQHVLSIDTTSRTAEVEGMVTYEKLVDATLPHGLMPLVVPQLKTITLGGAVAGVGIESSSFHAGAPHESVLEMQLLTGDAEIITVSPDNEHRDLFFGFPNSYGTLGYALRLRIELAPVKPFVHLRHIRHDNAAAFFADFAARCESGEHDFVDGTVFGPDEMYLTVASFVDEAPYTSDYTRVNIYYRSIQERAQDFLTVRDYLWRWDTDWFWCSRAFGVQRPWVRRLLPRRLLRSDVYWKLVAFERKYEPMARLDRRRGRPEQEPVVQDIEVPVERAAEFLDFFHREIPISPVWVCPLRQRDRERTWPLYQFEPGKLYVNFGFWSTVDLKPGQPADTHNRLIERTVTELDGRKSLYSTSFYDEDEFWRLYNGDVYLRLKKQYDPDGRLMDLYTKCVGRG